MIELVGLTIWVAGFMWCSWLMFVVYPELTEKSPRWTLWAACIIWPVPVIWALSDLLSDWLKK